MSHQCVILLHTAVFYCHLSCARKPFHKSNNTTLLIVCIVCALQVGALRQVCCDMDAVARAVQAMLVMELQLRMFAAAPLPGSFHHGSGLAQPPAAAARRRHGQGTPRTSNNNNNSGGAGADGGGRVPQQQQQQQQQPRCSIDSDGGGVRERLKVR
jgi:hypothetical protein